MSDFQKVGKKNLWIGLAFVFVFLVAIAGGAIADRLFIIKPLDYFFPRGGSDFSVNRLIREESVVINVAEEASPSVVTVSISTQKRNVLEFDIFGGFQRRVTGGEDVDIGTGFVVGEGLIVTNKHVVSSSAEYKVIDKDGKEYEVTKISRDPSNDIAILKINGSGLPPIELGDSTNLKVGQFVIAIGTALGELRHTVTTGVISGLGRGITAGSVYRGYVERLDDVIQTDAAINPGNSGGPLLNSSGQVIGINVAVAQGAQNIGFAIPIDIVKDALNTFKETGSFASKPFLGVQYQMITQQTAILNEVPQGAFVITVVEGSPAETAGVLAEDIIVKMDGQTLTDVNGGLAEIISNKKTGDRVTLEIWRNGEILSFSTTLSEFSE